MREVLPQLFTDFSPATKREDAAELKELMSRQMNLIVRYGSMVDAWKPSAERINKFLEKARQELRTANSQKYNERYAGIDDYRMIKQFDKIHQELKSAD